MTHSAVSPAQNTSPDSGAIDMEHLLHYTMGDRALAREVLGLFCTQGRIYLEQLDAALEPDERKAAAHTLKGSARGVGAHEVAARAEALEDVSASTDETVWSEALAALKTAFAEADRCASQMS